MSGKLCLLLRNPSRMATRLSLRRRRENDHLPFSGHLKTLEEIPALRTTQAPRYVILTIRMIVIVVDIT